MRIKNLTSKLQEIKVAELAGDREFTIYLEGGCKTDLEGIYIQNTEKLKGIIEFENESLISVVEDSNPDVIEEVEEIKVESEDSPEVEESTEPEVLEDKFICDICGDEFGSARGLSSHKKRAHQE